MAIRLTPELLREGLQQAHLDTGAHAAEPLKKVRAARAAAAELVTLEREWSKGWEKAIGLLRAVLQTWQVKERERDELHGRLVVALGSQAAEKNFVARYAKVRTHDERLVVSRDLQEVIGEVNWRVGSPEKEPTVGELLFFRCEEAKLHAIERVKAQLRGEKPPPFVSKRDQAARERARFRRFFALTGSRREKAWPALVRLLLAEAETSEDEGSYLAELDRAIGVLRRAVPVAEGLREEAS